MDDVNISQETDIEDENSLFVDEYLDDEIILDSTENHYERIEKIIDELSMMNHVWTEEEIKKFNEGVARYTIHDPIRIAKHIETKNAIQVSRRLYLIEEIMIHREPLSYLDIPAATEANEEMLKREQESSDEALEKEKLKFQKRANLRKDFKYIDSNVFEKRYGRSFLTHYHEYQAICELENSLKEWMRPIIGALIGFARQRKPNKKSKSISIIDEDVLHVLSYFGFNIEEIREKLKEHQDLNDNVSEDSNMEVENSS